jgi:hypothetical protein
MTDQSLRDALEKLAGELEYDVAGAPAKIRALLAAHPVEPARPMLDREQIKQALCSVDGPLMMRSADVRAVVMESQYGKSADAVLALLNGSGVDSSLHTCPGCGVKVVGNERCGDPTRPGCAS